MATEKKTYGVKPIDYDDCSDIPGYEQYVDPVVNSEVEWWTTQFAEERMLLEMCKKMRADNRSQDYIFKVCNITIDKLFKIRERIGY